MPCPHCAATAIVEQPRRTALGYRAFRCPVCRRICNERTGTPYNHLQYPTDLVLLAVLWRLRYKLSLRDLAEMFLARGFVFSREAVREWEARFAPLLDAHSRRVVGWAMADHLRTELPLDALAMALRARRPTPGLVHHTDRGSQYTATDYQARLAARGMICSMSRSGQCLDNAMAESFFATLKSELTAVQRWPTRAAARTAIFAWIEVFYNRQRRHSALAYRPPAAFEEELLLLSDRAA